MSRSPEHSEGGVNTLDVILRERSPEHSGGEATEESNDEARFLAEPVLSVTRFFATLRMTGSEGLRVTGHSYGKG